MENIVEIRVVDLPVPRTLNVSIYVSENSYKAQQPHVRVDNLISSEEKSKYSVEKILELITNKQFTKAKYDGNDLVFKAYDSKTSSVIRVADYDKIYSEYNRVERENNMSMYDATLEKNKINTVEYSEEYLILLRDLINKVEYNKQKQDEKYKPTVLDRTQKFLNRHIIPIGLAVSFMAGVAGYQATKYIEENIDDIVSNLTFEETNLPVNDSGIDKAAIYEKQQKNYSISFEEEKESPISELAALADKYETDDAYITDLYNSGLSLEQIESQLQSINMLKQENKESSLNY